MKVSGSTVHILPSGVWHWCEDRWSSAYSYNNEIFSCCICKIKIPNFLLITYIKYSKSIDNNYILNTISTFVNTIEKAKIKFEVSNIWPNFNKL